MKLCYKERSVSGKHREARQPTRFFIHTCEQHPVLPGVKHPNRVVEKQTVLAHPTISRFFFFFPLPFVGRVALLRSSSHQGTFVTMIDTLLKH